MNKMNIIFENKEYGHKDYQEIVEKFKTHYPNSKRIAVILKRSPYLLYLLNYLFENGITYIPIDPLYPYERIQYIINDSKPDDIIMDIDMNIEYEPYKQLTTSKLKDDVAYILYTSGSTGSPKGVEVTRENLMNFIDGISNIIDFSERKRIACFTTVAFDIFFLESIMALHKGLTVVLANDDEQRNPKLMADLIINNDVDMIQMTPSRMQLLLNYDKNLDCLKKVKEIMIGGEPFPPNLLKALQERTTAKIYNMYGPTETTIWSMVSDLTQKDRVDIGKPIKNTKVYIVDEELNVLGNGQTGEICIAGEGLAKGYYGQDNLTAERFVYLPQEPSVRIYKTGDLGRYLPDGELEYLGRMDNQIKVRGHRVELEEIEANINNFPGISQSVVRTIDMNETDKILEAVYVGTKIIDKNELVEFLTKKLPDYMIPAKFTQIEAFSYTPNGKIDRKNINLSGASHVGTESSKATDELSELQQKIFAIIKSNLNESIFLDISVDADFSSVGVSSITFLHIVVALENAFDFEFDDAMLTLTSFSTLRSMIDYVESKVS